MRLIGVAIVSLLALPPFSYRLELDSSSTPSAVIQLVEVTNDDE